MNTDALRAAFPSFPANESPVAFAYRELLGPGDAAGRNGPSRTEAGAPGIGQWLRARWRNWRHDRLELARIEALAPLSPQLLRDIGLSDEHRSIALARHESHAGRGDFDVAGGRYAGW
jgi:uncharacterized protein YjiS (DUF1127 family)